MRNLILVLTLLAGCGYDPPPELEPEPDAGSTPDAGYPRWDCANLAGQVLKCCQHPKTPECP